VAAHCGVFIRTESPPEMNSVIDVVLELPGGTPVEAKAIVVHRVTADDAARLEVEPGAGVQFVHGDDRFRERIDKFVAQLAGDWCISCDSLSGVRRPPFESQLFAPCRAVAEVHVDQRLVGKCGFIGKPFEVGECVGVQANRDLLLEAPCVWVLLRAGKVVFLPHRFHHCA
jgi:hypothetical protein